MAQDQYIKKLMNNYRPNNGTTASSISTKTGMEKDPAHKDKIGLRRDDINYVLQQVRELVIEGEKKRLIKIDTKNEEILKVLNPVFSVDVTRFINFILSRYFEEHPELIQEIKKSFKDL